MYFICNKALSNIITSATRFILRMLSTFSVDKLFINRNNDLLHIFDKVSVHISEFIIEMYLLQMKLILICFEFEFPNTLNRCFYLISIMREIKEN